MAHLRIRHLTTYSYASPVSFGAHRLMLRPRDSHDLRLVSTSLAISPQPREIRWMHDVFGNSVAVAEFDEATMATQLVFDSALEIETYEVGGPDFPIAPYARTYPFSYDAAEIPDLARSLERHYPDEDHEVDLWAKRFVRTDGPTDTAGLLAQMAGAIHDGFVYMARDAEGVQIPAETLRLGSGSCRDYALLMMEAARSLGFAARFVSGYLYSPDADGAGNIGGGATHAWVQIYLPGAGWVEFDPTNKIVGNRDLIRVAVVRDPSQAAPIAGSFIGQTGSFMGMNIEVSVAAQPR